MRSTRPSILPTLSLLWLTMLCLTPLHVWSQATKPVKTGKSEVQRVYLQPRPQPGVRLTADVHYLGPDRAELLDVYSPADLKPGQAVPCVIALHGGGFTGGNKSDLREQEICNTLALRGYVAVSLNYLLSDHTLLSAFPTNIHDCKEGIRFLRQNAAMFHIDPAHIGVIGSAAGGYLGAVLAMTKDGDAFDLKGANAGTSCQVQAAVDLYGTVDLGASISTNATATDRFLKKVQAAWPKERVGLYSPLTMVHSNTPPLLILHGALDPAVPIAQSERLAARLQEVHATNFHFLALPGVKASFGLTSDLDLRDTVTAFFDRYLKGKDIPVPAPRPNAAAPQARPSQ